ncbi:hypothetical protein B0I37DRAFT_31594 [Chaetomium sp. MPI-CAGE-AT-0009]|nr:hypothetical protein B0I37DRAFT_31594 [Chaetomium sp. MPI-CAGE-AT-0009]
MPGLTIATDVSPAPAPAQATTTPLRRASASSRPPSPSRPSVSPITPTHESAEFPGSRSAHPAPTTTQNTIPDFAAGRPIFTHTTQTDQVGIVPPPAQPIDFESNPDVLALKSAISILQLQRARATADVQSLSRARDAALANPEAFTADLASGRVRMEGDPLTSGTRGPSGGEPMEEDSSSDSDSDYDDDENARQEVTPESESKTDNNNNHTTPANGVEAVAPGRTNNRRRKQKHTSTPTTAAAAPPWQKLPKPQTVVRCPPVNWAQYGVVGESLDKLHAEQVAAPTPGAPMVLGQGGAYEFKAGGSDQSGGGGEPSRRLVGVAAPYSPMRDRLEKKGRGGKR